MKIVFSKIIPFKGFFAINICGLMIVRKEYESWFSEDASEYQRNFIKITCNHEAIHTAQMKEMLYIFFYLWYLIAWIFRLIIPPYNSAYYDISFEQEAYNFENDFQYLNTRKHYSWLKYIFMNSKQ